MAPRPLRPRSMRHASRGFTLVELLVGIALALFLAAAAATLLASQVREHRALRLEARLLQELRSAADIVTRDLRRAGHWGAAADGVWAAGASGVAANPYAALAPAAAASDAVALRYSRDAVENGSVDANEQFGFRLRAGALEIQLGAGNWQALTDAGTLTITAFEVVPDTLEIDLAAFCDQPCPTGAACAPRLQVRHLALTLTGRLNADPTVVRSLQSRVRVRNDSASGACAT